MQSVTVPLRWAKGATNAIVRWARLRAMMYGILQDIPEPRRSYWADRVRAIDTHPANLYDGHKVNNPNNESTSSSQSFGDNPEIQGGA